MKSWLATGRKTADTATASARINMIRVFNNLSPKVNKEVTAKGLKYLELYSSTVYKSNQKPDDLKIEFMEYVLKGKTLSLHLTSAPPGDYFIITAPEGPETVKLPAWMVVFRPCLRR